MCAGAKGENWRIGTGGPLALDRPTGGRNGGKQGWARNVRASRVGRQSDGRASRRNTSLPLGQERISLGWVLWRGTRRDAENDSTGNMEAQNCPRLPHNHIYKSRTWARRLLPSRQCADDMRSGRRQRQRGEWDRGGPGLESSASSRHRPDSHPQGSPRTWCGGSERTERWGGTLFHVLALDKAFSIRVSGRAPQSDAKTH